VLLQEIVVVRLGAMVVIEVMDLHKVEVIHTDALTVKVMII